MTDEISSGSAAKRRLQRPRDGRVLGGVCAAVARSLGVKPLLVRVAAVALVFFSGGSAVLAYFLAWTLIPQEPAGSAAADDRTPAPHDVVSPAPPIEDGAGAAAGGVPGGGVHAAWSAAGRELRSLACELRPVAEPTRDTAVARRSPVDTVDSVLSGVGERLRDPAVQKSARRTAVQVAAAVSASAEAVNQGIRRNAATAGSSAGDQTAREPGHDS